MRKRTRNKPGRSLLFAALLVAVIGGGLLGLHFWEKRDLQREAEAISARSQDLVRSPLSVYRGGTWYRLRDDVETYLIMGIDKFSERLETVSDGDLLNDLQTDFFLLMVVDRSDRSYTAIHINRDTMVEIRRLGYSGQKTGTVTQQLALSHTYGSGGKDSCRNAVQAVSRYLFDVPIDHYYAVTMDAIPVLTDLVGGVPVHVEDDLTPADPTLVQGTDVVLRGQQALTFVRARMTVADGTNLNRMNRQRAYVNSLYERMVEKLKASDRFAFSLAETLEGYSTSDLITDELSQLADRLKDYDFRGIVTVDGEAVWGGEHMEFYPDDEALRDQVLRFFFEPETSMN